MSREIKFRAWDKKRKEMLRITMMDFTEWWVSCRPPGTLVDPLEYGERNSFKNEETDRHILMQYTGLKDKNGEEIYDGDIVNLAYTTANFDVEYCNGAFKLIERNSMLRLELGDMWLHECAEGCQCSNSEYKIEEIAVIGNIYEDAAMSSTVDAGKK